MFYEKINIKTLFFPCLRLHQWLLIVSVRPGIILLVNHKGTVLERQHEGPCRAAGTQRLRPLSHEGEW